MVVKAVLYNNNEHFGQQRVLIENRAERADTETGADATLYQQIVVVEESSEQRNPVTGYHDTEPGAEMKENISRVFEKYFNYFSPFIRSINKVLKF